MSSRRFDQDGDESQAGYSGKSPTPHLALIGAVTLLLLGYAPSPAGNDELAAPPPLLINREHPLEPIDFAPPELVDVEGQFLAPAAADAYTEMAAAARAEGIIITAVSGYRPYAQQAELFARYTAQYGPVEAARISAPPGHSEHQSGLAIDIGNPDRSCALQACFAGTAAGAWAAENAWRYGFIIRYPEGAEAVTGYTFEPWHLRWIGEAAAAEMKDSGETTLEGYVGPQS